MTNIRNPYKIGTIHITEKGALGMKIKQAYAYLRVSGQGQLNGHGFDRQLEAIEAFCKKKGYQIADVFQEAVSGTTEETQRPAFASRRTALV